MAERKGALIFTIIGTQTHGAAKVMCRWWGTGDGQVISRCCDPQWRWYAGALWSVGCGAKQYTKGGLALEFQALATTYLLNIHGQHHYHEDTFFSCLGVWVAWAILSRQSIKRRIVGMATRWHYSKSDTDTKQTSCKPATNFIYGRHPCLK